MTEITQADRDAAEAYREKVLSAIWEGKSEEPVLLEAFARHRQYGYDQGYYDGRKMDGAEERAAIVAWCRNVNMDWCRCAEAIEAGEHLK
jgi:hypothetical protein